MSATRKGISMRRLLRAFAALTLAGGLPLLGMAPAHAAPKAAYDFHAGDGFGGVLTEPDVAASSNGDTVTVTATGSLDAAAKTAEGSGTFTHRAANGAVLATGDFVVAGLTAFQPYGCFDAGGGLLLCGGRTLLPVHITAHPTGGGTFHIDGVLEITCVVGSPPPGAREGIRLNVQDVINFNKSTEGETVFVQH